MLFTPATLIVVQLTYIFIFQGNSVVVYDIYPEAMSKLQDAGAHIGHNPAEVAENSDTIITMLPNSSTRRICRREWHLPVN